MSENVPIQNMQIELVKSFGEETARQAFGFISEITKPPAKELGGLLADHVKFYRLKTQIKILAKAREYLDNMGVSIQKVPLKFVANLLEYCSWEEDENMQKRWAALLANAVRQGENSDNYGSYVELLKQINPIQAKCLDEMYMERKWPARRRNRKLPSYQLTFFLESELNVKGNEMKIMIDSLIRLNLVETNWELKENEHEKEFKKDYSLISLTYLGQSLVKKCKMPFTEEHKKIIKNKFNNEVEALIKDEEGIVKREFYKFVIETYEGADEEGIKDAVMRVNDFYWNKLGYDKKNENIMTEEFKKELMEELIKDLEFVYT